MTELADVAADLAHRLDRLSQHRCDGELYLVEKSEIASELRRLARQIREIAATQPSVNWHRTAADADPRLRRRTTSLAAQHFRPDP
jgi:hypothetical protein